MTLQRITGETVADSGQVAPTWTDVGTYWAEVTPLTGRELTSARQIAETVDHRVEFRAGIGPITAVDRLAFGGRVFNISGVVDLQERGIALQVFCTEEVGG